MPIWGLKLLPWFFFFFFLPGQVACFGKKEHSKVKKVK